jgi:integrase
VSSWWSFSRIAPAHAGSTSLPRQPSHAPDGERHLRRSRSVQRLLFRYRNNRRTKATLIYRRTGNLRAVQLLLGHQKVESTVRYLGIEVDDALAIAEQIDV